MIKEEMELLKSKAEEQLKTLQEGTEIYEQVKNALERETKNKDVLDTASVFAVETVGATVDSQTVVVEWVTVVAAVVSVATVTSFVVAAVVSFVVAAVDSTVAVVAVVEMASEDVDTK